MDFGTRLLQRTVAKKSAFFAVLCTGCVVVCFQASVFADVDGAVQGMKLELAQLLFRHGDRSSIATFPGNSCDESCWPQGFGQLTQRGMRQHYTLGKYLHRRYREQLGLLNNTFYIRSQVSVRSTDFDRTIMSVQSLLAALYPPHGSQVFEPYLPWQPIPVHIASWNDSLLLAVNCPRYTEITDNLNKRADFQEMTRKHQVFMAWVQKMAKIDGDVTFRNAEVIQDTLFCQGEHNISQPKWATPKVQAHLKELLNFGMAVIFDGREAQRLSAGRLVGEILTHMIRKSENSSSLDKLYLYSGHDSTLTALLSALQVHDGVQPPYASALIIELYSTPVRTRFYIKVLYRNHTESVDDIPVDLTSQLPGCMTSPCPLEIFNSFASTIVPSNWAKECQASSSSSSLKSNDAAKQKRWKSATITVLLSICGTFAISVVAVFVFALSTGNVRKNTLGYRRVPTDI